MCLMNAPSRNQNMCFLVNRSMNKYTPILVSLVFTWMHVLLRASSSCSARFSSFLPPTVPPSLPTCPPTSHQHHYYHYH